MGIRDSVTPWISGSLPCHKANQKLVKDPAIRALIQGKIDKIRRLQYIASGSVNSEIEVFHVSKGADDIRLVYNGTSCGLNSVLWAPWFTVPTVNTLLRTVEAGTFMGDGDIGDQFHNFMLHPSLQSFVGVNFKLPP